MIAMETFQPSKNVALYSYKIVCYIFLFPK